MPIREVQIGHNYPDTEFFSDQVLLPAVARGTDVTIVTGFLSSYVARLVTDVAKSPEIEPGHISLTFCIPGQMFYQESDAARLTRFLLQTNSKSVVQGFVVEALKLANEGGLSLKTLIAESGSNITRSSIGLLQIDGASDFISFIDEVAGDMNSPITIARSWASGEEADDASNLGEVIVAGQTSDVAGIRRIDAEGALKLLREIATTDLIDSIQRELLQDRKSITRPKGAEKAVLREDFNEDEDINVEDLLEEFDDLYDLVEGSEGDAEDLITTYVRGNLVGGRWSVRTTGALKPVEHALPIPIEFVKVLHEYEGICRCGATYDRRYGCND
jgi:hypothetical protein